MAIRCEMRIPERQRGLQIVRHLFNLPGFPMKTLRSLAAFVLTLALPFSIAAAQGRGGGRGGRGGDGAPAFPTDDPIPRHLWALGMDRSQVWSLGQTFLDSIGPRLHGTPGIKSAHDWIVGTYTRWGISAKNEQYATRHITLSPAISGSWPRSPWAI